MAQAKAMNGVIFGDYFKQRKNNQNSKIIVMLPKGDLGTHPCLNSFKEMTEKEAHEEMQKAEWQNDITKLQ